MALTDKQRRFVEEYLVDLNATQAAIRAGYSERTAYSIGQENLKKPEIAEEIQVRQAKLGEEAEITAEWVLRELAENHRIARSIGELTASNKALELIGKHKGLFTERLKLEGGLNNTTQDITQLSTEERRARIDELNRRRGNGAHNAS